ncbi:hypothetical protein GH733_005233 [Mirounga leonina]|nr:hypothetical protein GH733_005233 [Mirounga leonina]
MAKSSSLNVRVVEGRALPAKDVFKDSHQVAHQPGLGETGVLWTQSPELPSEELPVWPSLDAECLEEPPPHTHTVAPSPARCGGAGGPLGSCWTATVWRSLSPFWGEEYTIHLPLDFHHLAFYVLDEDTVGHDDIIGKISLSREAIAADPRGPAWVLVIKGPASLTPFLIFRRDLAPRDITGTSDPFARVFWGSQSLETSTIKKTRFPHWDEVLELREMPGAPAPLRVELWDWDMVGKNDFLGMVEFPPQVLQQNAPSGWFRLLPFPRAEEDSGGTLGALRLKVRLIEDRILPSQYYQPLTELLMESVLGPAEEDAASPLAVLEELTLGDCRQDLATKLVKLFLGQGQAGPFLDYLTRREVTRTTDPNTLFRSNSLASKAMEQFMKLVGMPYLHEVLKPVINRVFEEKKYMELDPCKMDLGRTRRISFKGAPSEEHVRDASLGLLTGYLGPIVEAIDVKYLAISGFLFLRFFAPAILTPKLFDLRDQHADPQTSRSLLLLAKAVQSIGNLGQQLGQGKELWMAPLHPFLLQSISRVRHFLDQLVDVDEEEEAGGPARALVAPSVIVREGYLLKRKEEPASLATRFAFKKRYFWLSGETLSYSKSPEWQMRSSIPVSRIRAVERVDEGAFQLPHVMQVVTQDPTSTLHTTYLQCKNVNELNQWLSALRKASAPNPDKLATCHPGAFRSSRWTCCLQAERSAAGCSRTHSAVTLGDWSDPLDPDAEIQMVYRRLLLGRDQLRMKFQEDPNTDSSPEADAEKSSGATEGACPNALARQREAAAHLLEVLEDLDRAHEEFQQREQQKAALGPLGH